MSKQPTTLANSIPVIPKVNRIFTGFYKFRNTPPVSLSFNFVGTLKEARERFRKHCEVMGYIYLQCTTAVVDLDHREKMRNEVNADFNIDE